MAIQDREQDGMWLKQALGFPAQGRFSPQCHEVFTAMHKTIWYVCMRQPHKQELRPRTQSKVCEGTLWKGSTEQMVKLQGKLNVLIRSHQVILGMQESVFLPLAPERSAKCCQKRRVLREAAQTKPWQRRRAAASGLTAGARNEEQQARLQVGRRNSELSTLTQMQTASYIRK